MTVWNVEAVCWLARLVCYQGEEKEEQKSEYILETTVNQGQASAWLLSTWGRKPEVSQAPLFLITFMLGARFRWNSRRASWYMRQLISKETHHLLPSFFLPPRMRVAGSTFRRGPLPAELIPSGESAESEFGKLEGLVHDGCICFHNLSIKVLSGAFNWIFIWRRGNF